MNKFNLHARLSRDKNLADIVFGAAKAFSIKMYAAGANFILSIVLARTLGVDGTGLFYLALTIITLLSAFCRLGTDGVLLRAVAVSRLDADNQQAHGIYMFVSALVLATSTLIGAGLYMCAEFLVRHVFSDIRLLDILRIAALILIPMSLGVVCAQSLQGLKKVVSSMLILNAGVPTFSVIAIVIINLLGIMVTPELVSFTYAYSAWLTFFIGAYLWFFYLKPANYFAFPVLGIKNIISSSFSLYAVSIVNISLIWVPTLLIGVWGTTNDVGIYNAANRIATLTSFVLIAINSVVGAKFAECSRSNDMAKLERTAQQSTKLMTLLALPVLVLFIFMPSTVLSIFGPAFVNGADLLRILAIGQFINVASGSVALVLSMTGHEIVLRNYMVMWGGCALLIDLLFIYLFGSYGAAIASAISLAGQNVGCFVLVKKKLGITTIPRL